MSRRQCTNTVSPHCCSKTAQEITGETGCRCRHKTLLHGSAPPQRQSHCLDAVLPNCRVTVSGQHCCNEASANGRVAAAMRCDVTVVTNYSSTTFLQGRRGYAARHHGGCVAPPICSVAVALRCNITAGSHSLPGYSTAGSVQQDIITRMLPT